MVVDRIESPSRSIPTTLVKDMPFTLEMTCLEKTSVSWALCIGNTMIVSRGLKTPSPLSSDVAYSIIFITAIFLFHLVSPPSATTTTSSLGHHSIGDHLSCHLSPPPCLTHASVSHSNSFKWFWWACFFMLRLSLLALADSWCSYWAIWIELIFWICDGGSQCEHVWRFTVSSMRWRMRCYDRKQRAFDVQNRLFYNRLD
jgi:hypothetical protein